MPTVFFTDSVLACSMSSAQGVMLEYLVHSESPFVPDALRERSIEGTTREEYAAAFLAGLGKASFILDHAEGSIPCLRT